MLKNALNRTLHRQRLVQRLRDQVKPLSSLSSSCIFVSGGSIHERYDVDTEVAFRQESQFFWLTGLENTPHEACHCAINLSTDQAVFFVPQLGGDYALWCGVPPAVEEYKKALGFDVVRTTKDISTVLFDEWNVNHVYTTRVMPGELSSLLKLHSGINVDQQQLYTHMTHLRLRKTPEELDIMRKVSSISARAHVEVMKACKPGVNENYLEAVYEFHTRQHGCKRQAYLPIVAGDDRGATLHYSLNNMECADGGLLLIDAGAELNLYASDITRTFPVNGKFTEQQREIYEIVLRANKEVIAAMKPGVDYTDLHRMAERIIAEGLIQVGILRGSLQDVLANHVQGLFFPHGIGHSLGLDVHDPPNRDGSFETINEPGIRYLRIRVVLEESMVMTIEPGIYFIRQMLDEAKQDATLSKYINWDKVKEYENFGGIRIEDDVIVTKDGSEVMTHEVPKEVADIERLMSQQ